MSRAPPSQPPLTGPTTGSRTASIAALSAGVAAMSATNRSMATECTTQRLSRQGIIGMVSRPLYCQPSAPPTPRTSLARPARRTDPRLRSDARRRDRACRHRQAVRPAEARGAVLLPRRDPVVRRRARWPGDRAAGVGDGVARGLRGCLRRPAARDRAGGRRRPPRRGLAGRADRPGRPGVRGRRRGWRAGPGPGDGPRDRPHGGDPRRGHELPLPAGVAGGRTDGGRDRSRAAPRSTGTVSRMSRARPGRRTRSTARPGRRSAGASRRAA